MYDIVILTKGGTKEMDLAITAMQDSLYCLDDLLREVPYDDYAGVVESAIELKVRIENELEEKGIDY